MLGGIFPAWEKTVSVFCYHLSSLNKAWFIFTQSCHAWIAWVPSTLANISRKPHVVARLWAPECWVEARITITRRMTDVCWACMPPAPINAACEWTHWILATSAWSHYYSSLADEIGWHLVVSDLFIYLSLWNGSSMRAGCFCSFWVCSRLYPQGLEGSMVCSRCSINSVEEMKSRRLEKREEPRRLSWIVLQNLCVFICSLASWLSWPVVQGHLGEARQMLPHSCLYGEWLWLSRHCLGPSTVPDTQ